MSLSKLKQYRGGVYTSKHVKLIAGAQQKHNALATRIVYAAGLRECELLSLLPASERPTSSGINWLPERFLGRTGVRYTVSNRHGLMHEVMIPSDLATQLEMLRLDMSVTVRYRDALYEKYYGIGAGRAWGISCSNASRRILGWAGGPSMLRDTYAVMRIRELQGKGLRYRYAFIVRSQEMGYLRPRDRTTWKSTQPDINDNPSGIIDDCESGDGRYRGASRLDKYREEIEYIRYELKSPVNEIHMWLRQKHHLKVGLQTISDRLNKWKEQATDHA